MKNILILTYYFPPDPSIGSRRWAKFAKYLSQKGHKVTVLAASVSDKMKSPWDVDIEKLKIIRYERNYPEILDKTPDNLIEKIKYRLAVFSLKRTVSGTIYDRTVYLEKTIIEKASGIIENEKTDVLIANGPPHRILFYASLLKRRFPRLFLVSDFRDPWTWWYNYGYPQLSTKNKAAELKMEREVARSSDIITVTYPEMQEQILSRYPDAKVKILPHGFDVHEFPLIETDISKKDGFIRLVYFGTLYNGEELRMNSVAEIIAKNKNVLFDIYSDTENYKSIFESRGCGTRVRYFKPLPSKELFEKLRNYNGFLMVLPDKFRNNFSSKFYEIIYSGLPMILMTAEGDLTEYVAKKKAGIVIRSDSFYVFDEICNGTLELKRQEVADIMKYSFDHLTDELLGFIS